jgi:hypothetical protein
MELEKKLLQSFGHIKGKDRTRILRKILELKYKEGAYGRAQNETVLPGTGRHQEEKSMRREKRLETFCPSNHMKQK